MRLFMIVPVCACAGYSGSPCDTCVGGYYRLNDACVQCPKSALGIIIGIIILVGVCLCV